MLTPIRGCTWVPPPPPPSKSWDCFAAPPYRRARGAAVQRLTLLRPMFARRDLDELALALIRGGTSSGSSSSGVVGDTERLLGGIRTLEALVQACGGLYFFFSFLFCVVVVVRIIVPFVIYTWL